MEKNEKMCDNGEMKKVLYGLAGNPPHIGHWGCVRHLVENGYFVIISPSAGHAFGKKMSPFEDRLQWITHGVHEFCHDIKDHFEIWGGELALRDQLEAETVYSIDVLKALSKQYPQDSFSLAIGPDNAIPEVFNRFKSAKQIQEEFGVVVTPEQGATRSTAIRESLTKLQELQSVANPLDQGEVEDIYSVLKKCVGMEVFKLLAQKEFKIEGGYTNLQATQAPTNTKIRTP